MRLEIVALVFCVLLAGCESDISTKTPEIALKYPAADPAKASADAAAQCKYYGKTATAPTPQQVGDNQVLVFSCK